MLIISEEERSRYGAVAQLEEQLLCKQQVVGSIPIGSTSAPVPVESADWFAQASDGPIAQLVRAPC